MGIPLNIDWQQILLHLFNFVILAAGLYFMLYKPVKKFMAEREDHYKQMDDSAASKLEQASALEDEYRKKLEKADEELRQKKEQSSRELDALKSAELQSARDEAQKILSDARQSANAERDKIISSAQQEIGELAAAAAKRLIHSSMDGVYDDFFAAAGGESNVSQRNE